MTRHSIEGSIEGSIVHTIRIIKLIITKIIFKHLRYFISHNLYLIYLKFDVLYREINVESRTMFKV